MTLRPIENRVQLPRRVEPVAEAGESFPSDVDSRIGSGGGRTVAHLTSVPMSATGALCARGLHCGGSRFDVRLAGLNECFEVGHGVRIVGSRTGWCRRASRVGPGSGGRGAHERPGASPPPSEPWGSVLGLLVDAVQEYCASMQARANPVGAFASHT